MREPPDLSVIPFQPDLSSTILGWVRSERELLHWCGLDRFPASPPFEEWHREAGVEPWCLRIEGEVVGYGELWRDPSDGTAEIGRVLIAPRLRGRGLGGRWVTILASRVERERFRKILIRVEPDNEPALRSYARAGFAPVTPEEETRLNQGESRFYLWMALQPASLGIRKLDRASPDEVRAVQSVLDESPTYHRAVLGRLARPGDAEATFEALPPGIAPAYKWVHGAYLGDECVGCSDLIRGYPDRETAMLGLLILKESHQRRGLGREFYRQLENEIRQWPEIRRVRIGVVGANADALPFWLRLGFVDTGDRRPYESEGVRSESLILVKSVK